MGECMILKADLYREHGFLKGLYLGLKITMMTMLRNLFKHDRMTLNYPEEKYFYSDRFKGKHVLTVKEIELVFFVLFVTCNILRRS